MYVFSDAVPGHSSYIILCKLHKLHLHEIQQCTRWMYSSGTTILFVFLKKSSNSYNTIPYAGQGSISFPVKEEGYVLIP